MNLKFNAIYTEAIQKWPELIDFRNDISNSNVNAMLLDLHDSIDDPLIGGKYEVIERQLHSSIHIILHGILKNKSVVYRHEIPVDSVKTMLSERLENNLVRDDLDWQDEDYEIAKKYIQLNSA